jgi:multidrug efflux system membrane fusion protein
MNAKDDLPRRRRAGPVIGGLVLLAALGGGGFFYSSASGKAETKPKAAAAAPQAIPVQTSAVMTKDIPVEQSGLGIVTPLTKVDVKVRIDGQLQKMKFAEGQDVSAGDVIAEIDPKPYEVAVDQAQATYNKDLAQLNAAKIDEARAKRLTDTGSGTTQSLDTAAAQVAIYQATVDGDKAAVDKAKLDLSYASVTAPISGRAGFNQAEEGAIVRTSDTTGIVTITQMRPINVQFTLTQDELPALTAGQAAGGLPVVVNSRDGSKHLADGRLQVIDSQVDSTTGMVKLKALFPNDDGALWPGELVSARILLTTHKGSTVVPTGAILNGQTGAYVFVVKPYKTVASVPVTTGPAAAGMVTVAGLNLGDVVVTSGQSRLSDGTLISEAPAAQNVASSDKEQIQ